MPVDTEELVYRLRNARTIVALTGAGVSAASGIPTFRGDDGLWRNFRAEELATPEAFAHDPRTVWEWYDWRRTVIARTQPNPAHAVLATWSRHRQRDSVSRFHLGAALRRRLWRCAVGGSHGADDIPAAHLPLVRRDRAPGRGVVRRKHRPGRARADAAGVIAPLRGTGAVAGAGRTASARGKRDRDPVADPRRRGRRPASDT